MPPDLTVAPVSTRPEYGPPAQAISSRVALRLKESSFTALSDGMTRTSLESLKDTAASAGLSLMLSRSSFAGERGRPACGKWRAVSCKAVGTTRAKRCP